MRRAAIVVILAAFMCLVAASGTLAMALALPYHNGDTDPTQEGAVTVGTASFGSADSETSSWRINDDSTSGWLYYMWNLNYLNFSTNWKFSVSVQAGQANAQDDATAFAVLDGLNEWHFNYFTWTDEAGLQGALYIRDAKAEGRAPNLELFSVDNPGDVHTFSVIRSGDSADIFCDGVYRYTYAAAAAQQGMDKFVAFGSAEGNSEQGFGTADSKWSSMQFNVPEPSGLLLLLTGLVGILGRRRK